MACQNCCEKPLLLGSIDRSRSLEILSNNVGAIKVELTFAGTSLYANGTYDTDRYSFDLNNINESYTWQGRLLDANNESLTITSNTVEYDCIQFTTKMGALQTGVPTVTLS